MRRRLAVIALAGLVACVGPARTDASYRGKAATTLDQVLSAVETAQVGVASAGRHDLPAAYVSVLLAEAEDDASAADATFASIQPPSGEADDVRDLTGEVIDRAVDALATLRIEARRGDLDRLATHLPELRRVADELERTATELRG